MSENNSTPKKRVDDRTRNYACVVYPESAPSDWLEKLSALHVPMFVSPLHDSDINPTGEPKKPHFHVMAMFEGKKSQEQVKEYFSTFGGVGCEVINSIRGYSRYLCHLDNPEKHQYSIDDVRAFSGADYIAAIGTAADKAKAIREMISYISENDIVSFSDLLEYASINRSDWFDCLINSGAYVIKEYIKSRTWTMHHVDAK